MSLDPTPKPWRILGKSTTHEGERWSIWGPEWHVAETHSEDDAKLIVAAVNGDKVLLAEEDHELCETQISELLAVLSDLERSKSFDNLTHAFRNRVREVIRTRGITMRR